MGSVSVFERQSALGKVAGESRGWALVQAAAFNSTHEEFRRAMHSLLGGDLPANIGEVFHINGRQILKTGAEQYWIITRDSDDIVPGLQQAVPARLGAITSLSHSRTCIFVEGVHAAAVLAKGVPLDFHPEVFRVDHFALTGIHHTPVLIHRTAENRYDIYALRTYATTVWEWLIDAVGSASD
jgi:methylglutamate dehydrogenase subunit D